MKASLNFINSYFWRSIHGPIFAFIFPGVILVILGNIFKIEYIFPGVLSFVIMLISIFFIPLALSDMRKSSAFKFIGSSLIGKNRFLIFVFLYFVVIILVSIIMLFLFLFTFFKDSVWPSGSSKTFWVVAPDMTGGNLTGVDAKPINIDRSVLSGLKDFGAISLFAFSILEHMALSIAIAILIVALTNTAQQAIVVSICIILPTMFLSGMIISVDIIAESKTLKWISRFIPFTYSTGNIIESTTPIFDTKLIVSGYATAGVETKGAIVTLKNNDLLKKMILGREYSIISSSNSNIFDFTSSFAVRRVPEIERITDFVTGFLAGGDPKNPNTDPARFADIWNNNIKKSDYGFLELFFNQNNILYEGFEKALNIFIPIIIIVPSLWISLKKMNWNVR